MLNTINIWYHNFYSFAFLQGLMALKDRLDKNLLSCNPQSAKNIARVRKSSPVFNKLSWHEPAI